MANPSKPHRFEVTVRMKDGPTKTHAAEEVPLVVDGWLQITDKSGWIAIPEYQIISYAVRRTDKDIAVILANDIDNYNRKFFDVPLHEMEGRTMITFLDNRYTIIGERLSPDECREVMKHIRDKRCITIPISHE